MTGCRLPGRRPTGTSSWTRNPALTRMTRMTREALTPMTRVTLVSHADSPLTLTRGVCN
jgi:hypothetical protein